MKKLFLVDGNNLVMRYASVPGLNKMSHKGELTGAIHGAVKSILGHIDRYQPDEVGIVFDGLGASDRKRLVYAGYKAHRTSMLDSVFGQMETTRDILRAAGLFVFHEAGHDADDVIGCLAKRLRRSVLIYTNDKDFFGAVSTRISVLRPQDEVWDVARVTEAFVPPDRFAEYLALTGDSVDGIPGLRNCGPATAKELLSQYTWDELLRNPPPSFRKAVKKQHKELRAFLRLTTLDSKVLSDAHLRQILPRLTPGAYSPTLFPLLRSKGLRSLEKWFATHSNGVLSNSGSIFDAVARR